ncbi:glycoside hydrolase family 13 protein [Luteococcus sp. Sow4_B9]|uniref:glycoside hydrolase family 13 protein n=1 Tax=Luteococcus sp. Sow4_B9 TaxID=3438792 RepID=UPI003F96FEFD
MTIAAPLDTPLHRPRDWWRDAVVLQIYPRSFADSTGDGIGDLPGITSRIGHLAQLGVDAVWLSPFYPSQLADGGYDVDDHRAVDPRLGTLEDFDEMVATLHRHGIGVIVDLVPNHSSDRHRWFREALAAPKGSPARERYIFRDGTVGGSEPPNDWQSLFGGSAWQPVGDGQWYLHLFAPEQPDLNWQHPEVRADFEQTLRFWSDRGVDGFRVDVAHSLTKDLSQPWEPWATVQDFVRTDGSHPWFDRDELMEVYRNWRTIFDSYDPPRFAVAEAAVHPSRRGRYAQPETLGQAFNFSMQECDWRAGDFRRVIDDALADMAATGASTTWLLGCHDTPRVASRFGLPLTPEPRVHVDPAFPGEPAFRHDSQWLARQWLLADGKEPPLDVELGVRRARAAVLVELALPGCTYVYQGDELGLPEVADLPREVLTDPMLGRSSKEKGRDGCRVPLPWNRERTALGGSSFGFGSGGAHLPQPEVFGELSVEAQQEDPRSTLSLYREALARRRELREMVAQAPMRWVDSQPDVLHFARGPWHCATNFGEGEIPLPQLGAEPARMAVASWPDVRQTLPPATTVWFLDE